MNQIKAVTAAAQSKVPAAGLGTMGLPEAETYCSVQVTLPLTAQILEHGICDTAGKGHLVYVNIRVIFEGRAFTE